MKSYYKLLIGVIAGVLVGAYEATRPIVQAATKGRLL